ncbi:MAG: hypothetical protein FWJ85_09020 [Solitalea sp.]
MAEEENIEPVRSTPSLHEALPLQRMAWKIQKVCWVVIGTLMVLIALGLFGNGPISKVRETKQHVTMEYERFARSRSAVVTSVYISGSPAEGGSPAQATIGIPLPYLSEFELETVVPESYETEIGNNAIYYRFDVPDSAVLTVRFFSHPQNQGSVKGNWTVNGIPFPVHHFIYP